MRKRLILPGFILLYLLMLLNPAAAQEDGNLVIHAGANYTLDHEEIALAAQPLIDKGAVVAIWIDDASLDEADQWLRDQDLMRGDNFEDNLIGVMVSMTDGEADIVWGSNFENGLASRAEGIISGDLGPNLRDEAYTLAFVRTLEEINSIVIAVQPTEPITFASRTPTPLAGTQSPTLESTRTPTPSGPVVVPTSNYGYNDGYDNDSGDGASGLLTCFMLPALFILGWVMQALGISGNSTYSSSRPRYNSPWSSGGSSGRSSGGFGGFRGGGNRSGGFSGGGRSRGKF